MKFVQDLQELSKQDAAIAGGKGAGLGELIQAGFAVPKGFVLLANAFDTFLEITDINVEMDAVLSTVDIKKMHTVEEAGAKIQALITGARMPDEIAEEVQQAFGVLDVKQVAVRSSATAEDSAMAAWAGQLETYLHTGSNSLLQNIQRCFASLFSPRAIYYRAEMAKDIKNISVAVIVQEMVESDAAGVAFSVHPVTEDASQMLIEAVAGLGDKLVSGSLTPDTYVVDKDEWKVLDANVSGQSQALDAKQIIALAKDILRIEEHFGFPLDVEWCMKDTKILFLQSRAITTLRKNVQQSLYDRSADWVHYLTRPKSLFMASLWQAWYGSDLLKDYFGFALPNVLFLEQDTNVVRFYRERDAQQTFLNAIERIVRDEPERLLAIYAKAHELNEAAEQHIVKGADAFEDLEPGVNFLVELALHATVIPYLSLKCIGEHHIDFPEAVKHTEKLRAVSHYPQVMWKNLAPLAAKRLHELGFSEAKEGAELVTLRELRSGEVQSVSERLEKRKQGLRFIYQYLNGRETVQWSDNILVLMKEIEDLPPEGSTQLKGVTAYPGKVRGTARLVLHDDVSGKYFEEGDILVSMHSSPTMMPLICKCAAIVTDEGGASCHAAIVSRELKKPCVMSTKVATLTIADGDEIEVDADRGVVTLL